MKPMIRAKLRMVRSMAFSAALGGASVGLVAVAPVTEAAAQDSNGKTPTWSRLEESRETKNYKESIRETGALEDNARLFLQQTALPQLALPENRSTIERTRRRMRELLLDSIEEEKALDAANLTVLDFMDALARNGAVEPVVRVNAILLMGDLQSRDRRPWAAAAKPLASAASDGKLPMAVRIAALAGLARHVEAVRTGRDDAVKAVAIAEPVVAAILAEPAAGGSRAEGRRSAEADWFAARAAMMLPALKRPASKEVAAGLARMIDDPSRGLDVRIRAAAALGATADGSSRVDAAKAVDSIRKLAVTALENDLGRVDQRRFEEEHRSLAGRDQEGKTAAQGSVIPVQMCRRAAWRLTTLADAVLTDDASGGLARLQAAGGDAAASLAANLRSGGMAIDANPDEQSLDEALAAILQRPATGRPGREPVPSEKPAAEQPKPVEPPASPFEANPFGN